LQEEPLSLARAAPKRTVSLGEMLHWTYAQQRAHRYLETPFDWFLYSLEREPGAEISDPRDRRPVHRDAATLHAAVVAPIGACRDPTHAGDRRQPRNARPYCVRCAYRAALIVDHGIMGEPPERVATGPRPEPIEPPSTYDDYCRWKDADGAWRNAWVRTAEIITIEEPEYAVAGRKRVRRIGTKKTRIEVKYCPIGWRPDPDFIAMCDRVADEWEAAIGDLRRRLDGVRLSAHTLLDAG